jgi:hypothetical protein
MFINYVILAGQLMQINIIELPSVELHFMFHQNYSKEKNIIAKQIFGH